MASLLTGRVSDDGSLGAAPARPSHPPGHRQHQTNTHLSQQQ